MKKSLSILVSSILILLCVIAVSPTVSATVPRAPNISIGNTYYIRNHETGHYLTASGSSGSAVYTATSNGASSKWKVLDAGSGYYRLQHVSTSLYLDRWSVGSAPRDVMLYSATSDTNSWQIADAVYGTYTLRPKSYLSEALDIKSWAHVTSNCETYTFSPAVGWQYWVFEPVVSTTTDSNSNPIPYNGTYRSQGYKPANNPTHTAIDVASSGKERNLYAVASGTATFGYDRGKVSGAWRTVSSGNFVRLNAGGGKVFEYGHCAVFGFGFPVSPYSSYVGSSSGYTEFSEVIVGSTSVTRGRNIARSGTTGNSSGVHLHFSYTLNGVRNNPTSIVNLP